MSLLPPGYFPDTYWPDSYWTIYWPEAGPPVTPDLLSPGYWPDTYWPAGHFADDYWPNFTAPPPPPEPSIPNDIEIFGPQEGDVFLFQTIDEGDINFVNGLVQMTRRFETAVYLSLFGGNEEDDSREDSAHGWWGNIGETNPARKYISETQNLLQSIHATSANLLRIEEAARRDLQWFLDERVASEIKVTASIPNINRVSITIDITALGEEDQFTFTENWKAAT